MRIGVLALQGAFAEHEQMLKRLDVDCFEIRQREDLTRQMDGIILPGGESTVMGKLLRELGMLEPLKTAIQNGMPVMGTCAGLILLADEIADSEEKHLAVLPVTVKRNGYGRQIDSFVTRSEIKGIGEVEMTFIRAPYIEEVREGTEVLAVIDEKIVAVRYLNRIGMAFHPELSESTKVHQYFLDTVAAKLHSH